MCMVRDSVNLIAEEDIVVFKVLEVCEDGIITPFRRKLVNQDGIMIPEKDFPSEDKDVIEEGVIHSYPNLIPDASFLNTNEFLCKAIIPKGSLYIEGEYNNIASSKLIIDKIIDSTKVKKTYSKFVNDYFKL